MPSFLDQLYAHFGIADPTAAPATPATGSTAPGTGPNPGTPQFSGSTVGGTDWLSQAMNAITSPAAYGTIPQFAPTTTDTQTQTSSWTPSLPGYDNLSGQASALAGSELSGQLPPDVIAQIQEGAAERGISTGSEGSPNASAAYLQALGLNSLGLEQSGANLYQGLLAGAPRTTTGNQSETTSNANLIAAANAAPNPYLAAMANLGTSLLGLRTGAGAGGTAPGARTPSATIPTLGGATGPLNYGIPGATAGAAPVAADPNAVLSQSPGYNLGYDANGNPIGVDPSTDPYGIGYAGASSDPAAGAFTDPTMTGQWQDPWSTDYYGG